MTKNIDLTFEEMSAAFSYDAIAGTFTWKIAPSRRVKPGDDAGFFKNVRARSGKKIVYKYISLHGLTTPAARVAWLLQTGAWPKSNIQFKDSDTLNLKWENLEEGKFPAVRDNSGHVTRYKMSKEAQRHYGLKRYYGLSGEQYGQMLADQKGVCAICSKPETAVFNGQVKVMHVDHCHATNKIRALLCGNCNNMLGHGKDDPAVFRAAADYIEKHATTETTVSNVVPLTKKET